MSKTKLKKIFTVKEVANLIDETPNVVRNWMKELKEYIPTQKNESGYNVFNDEAVERMKLIQQLHRDNNYSIKQIQHYFETDGESYKPISEKKYDEIVADELREMKEQISELKQSNGAQEQFNQALIEKLDAQQAYIEEKINQRDKQLLTSIREIQETKLLAAMIEDKKWWEFWK